MGWRLFTILGLLMPLLVAAQESAEVFAPNVISTGHEFTVTFTPDGREVFFTRREADKKVNHVFHSRFENGAWQPASPVPWSVDDSSDLDPALSPDGKILYFVSTRPRPGQQGKLVNGKPDMDIWMTKRTATGWEAPRWVEGVNSDAKEGSPTIDRHGTLCFFSSRESDGKNRIYCAQGKGTKFSKLRMLGANINSGASDTSPWLSPDGRYLLFYSERPGGVGQADVYLSVKQGKSWSDPVNLGPQVNSDKYEYNPSLSPDSKTLYFGRDRALYFIPVASVPVLAKALAR
jgi:Tol biopolymer transport system component